MGASSAPGSVIKYVGRSHQGKSVTIELCLAILGWLVPPPTADDGAAPQTQASGNPGAGMAMQSIGWAWLGQETLNQVSNMGL